MRLVKCVGLALVVAASSSLPRSARAQPSEIVLGVSGSDTPAWQDAPNVTEDFFDPATTPGAQGDDASPPRSNGRGFIRVQGSRLKDAGGNDVFLRGINYWACGHLAADREHGGDPERFRAEMDQMQAAGINHLRVMMASEGAPLRQPFRILPALQPSPGQYDEGVWVGMDRCVAEAQRRNITLTATLGNTWQWSGGMAQVYSWAHGNVEIPYPRSWNISAPPQRTDGHPGWGNYTVGAPYQAFLDFANRFFTDDASQRIYRAHIDVVLNRRNSVTGRLYKEDPTILAWQPANEPQATSQPDPSDAYALSLLPNATDSMLAWHDDVASLLKRSAPHQLVSSGFEAKQGKWYFQRIHQSRDVDLACAHMWVENWGFYEQLNQSKANLDRAKAFARSYIANLTTWAAELPGNQSKPLLLEEFGMARNNWENLAAGRYQYHEAASDSNRLSYFTEVFGQVLRSFGRGENLIGLAPWAYGGTYRPSNQTTNSAGVVVAGDPDHESPGWYSVYSTDAGVLRLYSREAEEELLRPAE